MIMKKSPVCGAELSMEGIRNIIYWKPGNGFIKHAGLADISQNRSWHHGIRLFLLAVLIYLGLILTPGRHTFDPFFDIRTGTVADRDVIAPFDFSVYKSPEELSGNVERLQIRCCLFWNIFRE